MSSDVKTPSLRVNQLNWQQGASVIPQEEAGNRKFMKMGTVLIEKTEKYAI